MTSYDSILSQTEKVLKITQKNSNLIAFARLLFAVIFFISIFYISRNGINFIPVTICISSFILFLFFVYQDQKLLRKNTNFKAIINVCQNELLASKGNINQFENGSEFKNSSHNFSTDLDIFGNKSLFQLLNRCFTIGGINKLAHSLGTHSLEKKEIVSRQMSIGELKNKIEWRVDFLATGQLLPKNKERFEKLKNWLVIGDFAYFSKYKFFLWFVPILNIITFWFLIIGVLPIQLYTFITITQLLLAGLSRKNIKKTYFDACITIPQLKGYIEIFRLIEEEKFTEDNLKTLPQISEKLQKLVGIGDAFNLRSNIIGGLILNTFFFWDYQCAYRFEIWKKKYSQDLLKSFDVLNHFEVLVSMACFYDANSDYIFPKISEKNIFSSSNLGHPLINKEYRIYNDFQIENSEQFFIVTGANMAGKSTFLRTIGTNLVLAMIGCPVCAESFVFKPMPIFTCMRIDDSISEGKSYFHAELTRLKEIVELLERDEHVFIILDELLKGTNSTDKLKGSELFLEKLMNFDKCYGLIATHDLALTNMAGKFPDKIKNICFEVNIENDVMSFDYKLREGVTKNMNALFLMKQMQII